MIINDNVKRNLKYRRILNGLKQKEVAKIVGMSGSRYCQWEKYGNEIRIHKFHSLLKLANYYNISMKQLTGGDPSWTKTTYRR